ncbi:MAG: HigA family addiction module antitoxin [Candidatus Korobacteraceae bacterium]|jgi:antitoxin HigA-1
MSFERRKGAGWAVHPGEILNEEFLKPMEISGYRLAKAIGVNCQTVNDIVLRKRGISADMALRLGRFFGTTSELWMNLQSAYELAQARHAVGDQVKKIRPHREAA